MLFFLHILRIKQKQFLRFYCFAVIALKMNFFFISGGIETRVIPCNYAHDGSIYCLLAGNLCGLTNNYTLAHFLDIGHAYRVWGAFYFCVGGASTCSSGHLPMRWWSQGQSMFTFQNRILRLRFISQIHSWYLPWLWWLYPYRPTQLLRTWHVCNTSKYFNKS